MTSGATGFPGWPIAAAIAAALVALGLWYMIAMPGHTHAGPLAALLPEERALAERLRNHVRQLAQSERNVQHPAQLERSARYIEAALAGYGLAPEAQVFESGGREVRNIEAVIPRSAQPQAPALVVGAHYDTVPGSPGANDNASGAAVLIELARLLAGDAPNRGRAIRLVAFVNEEPPYFMSRSMGSEAWARRARSRGDPILAMLSLEMLGFYRDAPGTQRHPFPLGVFYPDRADFIAFVGDLGSRPLVRRALAAFRAHAAFPSEGVAAPGVIPGVTWSDHWSFRQHGYPAIMVTDTAFYRYPHYHLPSDTPDKLDYERMARVTMGLAAAIRELLH
jgi:hypothetical protein